MIVPPERPVSTTPEFARLTFAEIEAATFGKRPEAWDELPLPHNPIAQEIGALLSEHEHNFANLIYCLGYLPQHVMVNIPPSPIEQIALSLLHDDLTKIRAVSLRPVIKHSNN
jgi:hypothetical protein